MTLETRACDHGRVSAELATDQAASEAAGDAAVDDGAERVFSTSIVVSAIRCTLTYVVFPFVAPLLGLASDVGPSVGLVIGVVAIIFNVLSIRRFWAAGHKYRKHITVANVGVIILLSILLVDDIRSLLS